MSFVSYAQNAEDVLLWRALGHLEAGFYIDVGANDPVEHSVTKAFYDAGWRGISIEPLPAFHQAFLEQRPRDVNLALAAGAADGELTLYDVPAVRGWASPEQAVAEQHRAEGFEVAELKVPVRTLASICEQHVDGEIHFLKIDVEGFEETVLRGMDFSRWRPWVLVIEATLPNSRATNHQAWEHLVTGQGYRFAWFDGLNRYYVADEHPELLESFGIQPNVFDEYISYHLDRAWASGRRQAKALEASEQNARDAAAAARLAADDAAAARSAAEATALDAARRIDAADRAALEARDRADLERAQREAAEADSEALRAALADALHNSHLLTEWAQGLEQRLVATHNSTSWRVTRPLRALGSLVRSLRRPGLARRIVTRLTRSEPLRRLLIPLMLRFPRLGRRVGATVAAIKQDHAAPAPLAAVPDELKDLPVSVRAVLGDLQRARRARTGGQA